MSQQTWIDADGTNRDANTYKANVDVKITDGATVAAKTMALMLSSALLTTPPKV